MCLNNAWRHHTYFFMQKFSYKNFIQKFFIVVKQIINSKVAVFIGIIKGGKMGYHPNACNYVFFERKSNIYIIQILIEDDRGRNFIFD